MENTNNTVDPQAVEAAKAAYEAAQKAQAAAKTNLENLNNSLVESRKQFDALKKILDGAKPSLAVAKAQLQKADADVTITRATLNALSPVAAPASNGKGAGQSELCAAVVKVLSAQNGGGMTVDEILNALQANGVEMAGANPRDNLSAYIGRWSKVPASGIVSKGRGVWGVEGTSTPAEVPSFLAPAADTSTDDERLPAENPPAEVPSFLAPAAEAPAGLPAGFPGREALMEAGFTTLESLSEKTVDQLRRVKGVGAETARNIVAALAPAEV